MIRKKVDKIKAIFKKAIFVAAFTYAHSLRHGRIPARNEKEKSQAHASAWLFIRRPEDEMIRS